ncbi:MAG: hypothetical protein IPF93_13345 [Saprospiraceae bacterium]|nr:hypothetical protein [Saprospiraceae bacterium]
MIKSNKIILRKNLIFSLLFSFIGGFVFGQAHEASSAPEQHDVEHPAEKARAIMSLILLLRPFIISLIKIYIV